VVYFLDGQNVFDASRAAFGSEWSADETARQLIDSQRTHPFMIVAIDNSSDRVDEYTPVPGSLQGRTLGGAADKTLAFLREELKPWIDREFPTQPNPESNFLVGSSLGGLTALHALQVRSDVFGGVAAVSPSLFWGEWDAIRRIREWTPPKPSRVPLRLWVDMGTQEGEGAASQRRNIEHFEDMRDSLSRLPKESVQVHAALYPGAQHREADWAARLPEILEFLLEGREPSETK
jgi:predicted alpha/beta superfamily hydrolase